MVGTSAKSVKMLKHNYFNSEKGEEYVHNLQTW